MLCFRIINIETKTVNTTSFWCLLKLHDSTHVVHLQAKHCIEHIHALYIAFCGHLDLSLQNFNYSK